MCFGLCLKTIVYLFLKVCVFTFMYLHINNLHLNNDK